MAPNKQEIEKFTSHIETIVKTKDLSYIDAILNYCSMNGAEVDSVVKLIPKPMKLKLSTEAVDLNLLKKGKKK